MLDSLKASYVLERSAIQNGVQLIQARRNKCIVVVKHIIIYYILLYIISTCHVLYSMSFLQTLCTLLIVVFVTWCHF